MRVLTMRELKRLEGQSRVINGRPFTFETRRDQWNAAHVGGEGFATPLFDSHGVKYILKGFHRPQKDMRPRLKFLVALDLASAHPLFSGAPVEFVNMKLQVEDGDARVFGHLAHDIEGAHLGEGAAPSLPSRIRLATELCSGIDVLEAIEMTHGDLSMRNVLVARKSAGRPSLRLIDFDGFYHPAVWSQYEGGSTGLPGYRHPHWTDREARAVVTSDRFAMATLAFELVTADEANVGEPMLDQGDIDGGTLRLPNEAVCAWPEGADLLHDAFEAATPRAAPSPARWQKALKSLAARQPVQLVVEEADLPPRRLCLTARCGTLGHASPHLDWLSYCTRGRRISLHGKPEYPLFLTRNGSRRRIDGLLSEELRPGDLVQWLRFMISRDEE